MKFKTPLAAASVLALSAGVASAATTTFESGGPSLSAGDEVLTNTALVGGGDSESIEFTALDSLALSDFLLTGNGFNSGDDLMAVTFGYTRADGTSMSDTFDDPTVSDNGTNAIDMGSLEGSEIAADEMFSFTYDYSGEQNADVDMSFTAGAVDGPAPIPVPAAGGLLLGALGFGGFVAGRKKKSRA